jgi:hypothetical protein
MNNNRLSTNKNSLIVPNDLKLQAKKILTNNNFELGSDDKILILSSQKILTGPKNFYLYLLKNKNYLSDDIKL